jgi:hypothetical protein
VRASEELMQNAIAKWKMQNERETTIQKSRAIILQFAFFYLHFEIGSF